MASLFTAVLYLLIVLVLAEYSRIFRRRSHSPPVVPFLIPWLGHTVCILTDPLNFVNESIARYGSVFSARVMGRNITLICNRAGIMYVLKNPDAVFDSHTTSTLAGFGGLSPDSISSELLNDLTNCTVRSLSNKSLSQYTPSFNHQLLRRLHLLVDNSQDKLILLHALVGDPIYCAASYSLWGPQYPAAESFALFATIDANLARLMFLGLEFLSDAAVTARREIKAQLGEWLDSHTVVEGEDRKEGISELIRILKDSPLTADEKQGLFLALSIGIHANTMRCITWLVAFLLCDEAALQKLRNEVDTVIDTTFGSMENLQKASPHDLNEKTLPLLHSAVLETLRLAVVAITARPAAQGAAIPLDDGTYVTIKGGTEVIANGYTLNLSESSFDNATAFQIDRFVDGDPEALATLIPPFGLGKHVCKGRDFAMYEMKMFILILLRCFTFTGHTKDGNKIPDGQVPRRSMTALITPALYLKEEFYVRISPRS